MKKLTRNLIRLAVLPAALGALAIAGPASAHVTIAPSETAAGAYTILTVSVPHGCDGSPTTRVAIKMPSEITAVTPTRNPLYDLEKVTERLDEPITSAHGEEVTERTSQIVYTAKTPLPEGERDAFELSLRIPEEAAGSTLVFPTIQTCVDGEAAWTEVPSGSESAHDLAQPAPSFVVAAAATEDSPAASPETAGPEAAADSGDTGDSGGGLAVVGLVTGLLGLVLGALALVRTRGRGRA